MVLPTSERVLMKFNGGDPLEALNTPNLPKPNEYRWSTFMPGRTPKLKVHRYIGHAKNALGNGNWWLAGCKIYELNNGVWNDVTDAWIEMTMEKQIKREEERHRIYSDIHSCPYCRKRIK